MNVPPPADVKKDIYSVYTAIFNTNLSMPKKNALLTPLLGAEEWSWKVVGISENAFNMLQNNGYQKTKGIQRAHIVARMDIAKLVFDKSKLSKPLIIHDFFEVVLAKDKTVLVKKEENTTHVASLKVIPISSNKVLFPCLFVGYKHHQDASKYLCELHQKFNDGKVSAVQASELLQ